MKTILALLVFLSISCASAPTEPKGCTCEGRCRPSMIPENGCKCVCDLPTTKPETYSLTLDDVRRQFTQMARKPETTIIVVKVQVEYPLRVFGELPGGDGADLTGKFYPIGQGIVIDAAWLGTQWRSLGLIDSIWNSAFESTGIGSGDIMLGDTAAPL